MINSKLSGALHWFRRPLSVSARVAAELNVGITTLTAISFTQTLSLMELDHSRQKR
jgi:hypothetical protein